MKRIVRTLTLMEIETPNGEMRYVTPGDTDAMAGNKVLGIKKVHAEIPISVFIANATIKEVK